MALSAVKSAVAGRARVRTSPEDRESVRFLIYPCSVSFAKLFIVLKSLADFILSWPAPLETALFCLTFVLFCLHFSKAAIQSCARPSDRRGHAAALIIIIAAAALARIFWAPKYFLVMGQDIWELCDTQKVFCFTLSTIARSPAHAILLKLYMDIAGTHIPSIFFLNMALGVMFSALTYSLAYLYIGDIFSALCAALTAAFLPSSIIASGGVGDFALSSVLVAVFFICLKLLAERKTRCWFYASSCALALAAQARFDNPGLYIIYAAVLLRQWRDFPRELKSGKCLALNAAYLALAAPYSIYSAVFYTAHFAGHSNLPADAGNGNMLRAIMEFNWHRLMYSGSGPVAIFLFCLLVVTGAGFLFREKIYGLWPLWLFGLLFLLIYVPHEGFESWYPMAAAAFAWIAIFAIAHRLVENPGLRKIALACSAAAICVIYSVYMVSFLRTRDAQVKKFLTDIIASAERDLPPDRAVVSLGLKPGSPNNILPFFVTGDYLREGPGNPRSLVAQRLQKGEKVYFFPQLRVAEIAVSSDDPLDIRWRECGLYKTRRAGLFTFEDNGGRLFQYEITEITGVAADL